jgi:pimeloyl-ACP methyl ester carboxylesterase
MTQIEANGIRIEYEAFGSKQDPALLLIMGFAAQLTLWPDALCEKLAVRGLYVVRYDNRDVGLSTKFEAAGLPDLGAIMTRHLAREDPGVAYGVDALVADAFGLMDALKIEKAHVMGFSMGGMIAQRMAAAKTGRILSLTSLSSSSADPSLPPGDPDVMTLLTGPPPESEDLEIQVEHPRKMWRAMSGLEEGHGLSPTDEELRQEARDGIIRGYYPEGAARQMAAMMVSSPHTDLLTQVNVPTLVLHGSVDPVVNPEGGKSVAARIDGARFEIIEGMGHVLFSPVVEILDRLVGDHVVNSNSGVEF